MDTMWFAVDRDGHVAVFDSGEAGAVPTEGYNEDWGPILDELVKAAGGKPDGDDDDWDQRPAKLAALGLYYYRHDEFENALAGAYDRIEAPATPIGGDRVPRGLLKEMVSFDGRFAETARLQPVEHWQSEAWSEAWISSDGKSVRCLPGHEAEYAQHFDDLVAAFEPTADMTIEPPSVAAAPKPPPTAKALPPRRWWQFWKK
jgi:hypothetical protein